MKKLTCILLLLLLLLSFSQALAGEAEDLTAQCTFQTNNGRYRTTGLYDGSYSNGWRSTPVNNPYLGILAPKGKTIHGLYVAFADLPGSYEIQIMENGNWVDWKFGGTDYVHMYWELPGVEGVRIYVNNKKKYDLSIQELRVLGEGDVPEDIQIWEPTVDKADILFVVAHPDDDLIFMGGAIPTYDTERKCQVAVAYLTYSTATRRSELLNALWSMGVRRYPILGDFKDLYRKDVTQAYKICGGSTKVVGWLTEIFRRYRPEVVVTHDPEGEYGHGQHKMLADACERAWSKASDESSYPESAQKYGTWQVKKLYEHLAGDKSSQIRLDWSVPLQSLGGITGLEAADRAFGYHLTQQGTKYDVIHSGAKYSNETFGLVCTRVGPDVKKNDFLENIPGNDSGSGNGEEDGQEPEAEPSPEPAVNPEAAASPIPSALTGSAGMKAGDQTDGGNTLPEDFPGLNEKGFLPEGEPEYVYADAEEGLYIYVSQTLKVIIERRFNKVKTLTWFEAEIWTDTEAGELPANIKWNPDKPRERADASKNALEHKVVFATNADYYTYRIGSSRPMGVIIRDGQLLYNSRYDKDTGFFPNMDSASFYPDGSMQVRASYETDGAEYLRNGAYLVYSFGPYLIRDGVVSDHAVHCNNSKQPRYGFGMVEPGHYVAVLCEGRLKRSKGVTLFELANLMKDKGCTQAINLDGGQTAVMIFMGQRLNLIGKYDGKTNPRKTNEILGFGTSELVGELEIPILEK